MLQLALEYGRYGISIFPCSNGGTNLKQPLVRGGHLSAVHDPKEIATLWSANRREALIGLPCQRNDLIVIDADRHGADDGVDAINSLFKAHNFVANSNVPVVATPNHGVHFYFRRPGSLTQSVGRIGAGIDIRDNGYVIAPGSRLMDGRRYELTNGSLSDFADAVGARRLLELPVWLLCRIARQDPHEKAISTSPAASPALTLKRLRGLVRTVATAPQGVRNSTLFWASCRVAEMVGRGELGKTDAEELMLAAAAYAGLPVRSSLATIRSGFINEQRSR